MNQAVKTGIVSGIIILILLVCEKYSPPGKYTAIFQFANRIVYIAGVYIAVKRTRDIELKNEFPFKLGLKAGLTYGIIASLFLYTYTFFQMQNMDLYAFMDELRRNGADNTIIRQRLLMLTTANAFKIIGLYIVLDVLLAFFVSVAASLLLRKRGGLINQQ